MITMKDIIREGHKTLSLVAKEVKLPLSQSDKKLAEDLLDYVKNSQDQEIAETHQLRPAVGLAAPQVNVSKRMFAVHVTDFDGILYSYVLINPVVKQKSSQVIYLPGGEGCLSVDRETEGLTPRYEWVEYEAFMYDSPSKKVIPIHLRVEGYVGIVFQHEFDHINGILYTTKLFPNLEFAKPAFEFNESLEDESN
jgi:peptide deformylase